MTTKHTILLVIVALMAGYGLAWAMNGGEEVVYRDVEVPVERIREVERVDTVVDLRERIVFRTGEPETVAVATGAARPDLDRFCGPLIQAAADSASGAAADGRADVGETPAIAPALLLRSARTEPGWFWRSGSVVLTGPTNTGDVRQFTYRVRPGWQAAVAGDSILMQTPRFGWVRELTEAGVYVGAGYLLGSLLGL